MPYKITIIYHQQDEQALLQLNKFFKIYEREGNSLSIWHCGLIIVGQNTDLEIRKRMQDADMIILLCSVDLFSDEESHARIIYAVDLHQKTQKIIVPILLRPFDWKATVIADFKPLPKNEKPIQHQDDIEQAYVQVAQDIISLINQAMQQRGLAQIPEPEAIEMRTTVRLNLKIYEHFKVFLKQNEQESGFLFALAFPSSLAFLQAICSKPYIHALQKSYILRETEDGQDIDYGWHLEHNLVQYLQPYFQLTEENMEKLARKCVVLLKDKNYEEIDLLNMFHLLISFYDKCKFREWEDEIVYIFSSIKFRAIKNPLGSTKILNLFLQYIDSFSISNELRVSAINNCVIGLDTLGNYDEAMRHIAANIAFCQKHLGELHLETAKAYQTLANLHYEKGAYKLSAKAYAMALAIAKENVPENNILIAILYQNIARPYYQMGNNLQKVEFFYQKALSICQAQLNTNPETDRLILSINANLSVIYEEMGLYSKAQQLQIETIMAKEEMLGKDHPSTAMNYNNLANIYLKLGKNNDALNYAQKAIQIRTKYLGKEHPYTLISQQNLASIYIQLKELDKAAEILAHLIAIYEQKEEFKYYFIATDEYANICIEKKQYDQALTWLQKNQDQRQQIYGKEHVENARHALNIANLFYKKQAYDEAIKNCEEVIAIFATQLGNDHPNMADALFLKGKIMLNKQQYSQSQQYLNEALKIYLDKLGNMHPQVGNTYAKIAQLYQVQQLYEQALQHQQKALDVQIACKNQTAVAQTLAYILDLLLRQNNPQFDLISKYLDYIMQIKTQNAYLYVIEILNKQQSLAHTDLNRLLQHIQNPSLMQQLLIDLNLATNNNATQADDPFSLDNIKTKSIDDVINMYK